MLKLREPISLKINLHIGQDMLQRLWDKYVPVSSSVYGNIQLVYRNETAGQEAEQMKQVRLLISLVLKNRMMQMGVEQYPSSLAFGIKRMNKSLRRTEKYYLTQLKSSSPAMYRTLSRYIAVLEQEEWDNRRYRDWQEEHQVIEKQWERLRLLSLFSVQIKERLEEHSLKMSRTLEKELFASLSETEYGILRESSIWQEKSRLAAWLKTCSKTQCQQILGRLEKETALCRALAIKVGIFDSWEKGKKNKLKKFAREKYLKKKNAKVKWKKEEIGIRQIFKLIPGYSEGEKLAAAADMLDRKEFGLFYCQIVYSEGTDRQFVMWKSSREEMISYINQAEMEKVGQLWTQIDKVFPEKLVRLQEQHLKKFNSEFGEQVFSMVKKEPFLAIADVADAWDTAEPQIQAEEGKTALWNKTGLFIRNLEQIRENWKESIKQQEARVFEKYQQVYREVLRESNSKSLRQENVEHLVEETFRMQHREAIEKESITEEEIRNICEWGRMILESADTTHRTETTDTMHRTETTDMTHRTETTDMTHRTEIIDTTRHTETTDTTHRTELTEFTDAKQRQKAAEGETYDESVWIRQSLDLEQEKELVYLIRQINHYMKEKSILGEVSTLVWQDNPLEKEKIQKLAVYLGEIKEEQKTEFVRQLADAVLIWQRLNIFRQAAAFRQENTFRQLFEEEPSEDDSVMNEETIQTAAKRREEERLAEETFRMQHREAIEKESITEEEIRNICEWGRMILESVDTAHRTVDLEQEKELVYLIRQINHYMEEKSILGEASTLVWQDNPLEKEKIQKLAAYLGEIKEEQKTEFVRQLADAVLIWQQVNTSRQVLEKEFADAFLELEQNVFPEAAKREEMGQMHYRELWEWGEALLFYPKHEQALEEADIVSGQEQEVLSFSDSKYQEDVQTQIIRRQIEAAKDRNSLQQLITRINYQIGAQQTEEKREDTIQTQEELHLVYADSQMKEPSVQRLIDHIRTLEEEEYNTLVKELSKVIPFQWRAYLEQKESVKPSDKQRQKLIQKFMDLQMNEKFQAFETVVSGMHGNDDLQMNEKLQAFETPRSLKHREAGKLAAAYPGFVWRIQEYERQRNQTVQKGIRKFVQGYAYPGTLNQIDGSGKLLQYSMERGEMQITPDALDSIRQRELQYSIQRSDASGGEWQRAQMRMQEETMQMKSVQSQLDKKLKEVETQLRKVESRAKAKEDVSAFADQVKKQLYEELHIEKLRRGLI